MAERNIFAFFRSEQRAKQAVQRLKEQGFDTVSLSRFNPDLTAVNSNMDIMIGETLGKTMGPAGFSPDTQGAEILQAADEKESGMADGSDEWGAEDLSVTVITDETRAEEAEQLLKEMGGNL
ncbi:hypothetical protein [Salinithrix halophila]|uniref:Heat induced stress protein YflT n=1 Tax=Salinithrix halophila TaxID=1485204 RepID=A0ABV8JGH7_9BACL